MTTRIALNFVVVLLAILGGLAPNAQAALRSDVYVSGLSLPVAFIQDPTNVAVQYVVEQRGRIRVIVNGALTATDLLNLVGQVSTGGEQGLLGLAFAPDYGSSGRLYVNFTNAAGHTVIARFKRSANPLVADPATRFDLRWPGGLRYITQPYANHNGGTLAFGPDGYLYIGMGDGGDANDPGNRAQNLTNLLGKMLRIDVNVLDSDPEGYDIPPGNPFSGGAGGALPEIWSVGLRNPWKFSFDDPVRGGTGAMIIGDVGQNAWEEIDYEPAGAAGRNYGWRNREGAHNNIQSNPPIIGIDPVYDYPHTNGNATVTGGYVYRGEALGATYVGRYFFADYISGRVWSLAPNFAAASLIDHTAELGGNGSTGLVSSFGVDAYGELYVVSYTHGRVLRILPPAATVTTGTTFPATWGSPITWTAASSAGTPPLQYQFWRLKLGVGWELVRDYSTSNSYTWTPGPADGGTYTVQVWVRSDGSIVPYETWGSTPDFTIVGAPPLSLTLTSNRAYPVPAYIPVTWTAIASGGNPPLQYQFWRLKSGVGWTMVQDYSALNTYTWIPAPADAGTYSLQVWARSTGSANSYDTWVGTANFGITGPAPVQLISFGADVPLSGLKVGTPVTWSAAAFGGTPPVQFKFYLFSSYTGGWSVLQDYSPASSVTWTPTTPSTFVVQVWARSATSAAAYDDWRGTGSFVAAPSPVPVVTSFTPGGTLPVHAGTPETWTAQAVGGTQPYQYQFWRLQSGVGWVMVQDYSLNPSYTWTPGAGETGTYLLQVWVRSAGSSSAYDGWQSSGYFEVVP